MDPQKLSQLDPKLREAYQRVMGTAIPEPQAKSDLARTASPQVQTPSDSISTSTPQHISKPASQTISAEPFFKSQSSSPEPAAKFQPIINSQPLSTQTQSPNFTQMNSEVSAPTEPTSSPNFTLPSPQIQTIALKKKKNVIIPIVFGIAGFTFLIIYTLFWTKIFNLKLPFLP